MSMPRTGRINSNRSSTGDQLDPRDSPGSRLKASGGVEVSGSVSWCLRLLKHLADRSFPLLLGCGDVSSERRIQQAASGLARLACIHFVRA